LYRNELEALGCKAARFRCVAAKLHRMFVPHGVKSKVIAGSIKHDVPPTQNSDVVVVVVWIWDWAASVCSVAIGGERHQHRKPR
jgi:hypothetical protein